jgi:adenylate kinase
LVTLHFSPIKIKTNKTKEEQFMTFKEHQTKARQTAIYPSILMGSGINFLNRVYKKPTKKAQEFVS